MGNAKFYYYPEPEGSKLVTIDLGEKLGELFSEFEYDTSDSISRGGRLYRSINSVREVVTIQRDRMILGEDVAIQLQSMQNHLDRGGYVSFCADSDKSYLFPINNFPNQGDTSLKVGGNPLVNIVGTGTASADDYVVIQTQSPNPIIEYQKVQSTSGLSASNGGTINLDSGINFTYDNRLFVRYYRFFPTLRRSGRDVGTNIVTNENGRLFSLNLRLYMDDYTLFNLHPSFDGIARTPNFGGNNVPSASGGDNPFAIVGDAVSSAQIQSIRRFNNISKLF